MGSLTKLITELHLVDISQALILTIIGFFVARIASNSLCRFFKNRLSPHQSMLVRRVIFYIIFFLFITSAIQQLGFRLTALLGATGLITVALGIASQTSMSNVISGLFIIGEKPFEIGDTIKVNDLQGEVIAINYLSVRIRTSDNMMVRIPNELLIKSPITNISYFPIRRFDLTFALPQKSDLEMIKQKLLDLAKANAACLDEPPAVITVASLIDNGMQIQFSAWAKKDKYNDLKNTLQTEINAIFSKNNIAMPTPMYNLQVDTSEPWPIQIIAKQGDK
jgi:small-conductance mechanosensitive channel